MTIETSSEHNSLWAFKSYLMESGRILVIELDPHGHIIDSNVTFRSRFADFNGVKGKPLGHFFATEGGESLSVEPGLPGRTPIPHIVRDRGAGELHVLQAYPFGDNTLLIGERADSEETDVIERMSHLAMELSRLVRDLRKTNHELALANDRNKALARADPLTGIANRRYFMERLRISIDHSQGRGHSLSLMMLDIDHFKRINDQFGHASGDSVLIAIAALLLSQVRAADLAGRYGGEEFVLYMLDADLQAATEAAERIRVQVSRLRPIDSEQAVTASFGVTELTDQDDADSLLKRADHLLYRAKEEGRNRVIAGMSARKSMPR